MSDHDNNNIAIKRLKPRYINIRENIFHALTPQTYAVYTALRFDGDYEQESSKVKRTATQIATIAKISRRAAFTSFNELENAGLLLRESKQGYETAYWIADELGYFKVESKHQESHPVQEMHTPVQEMHTPVQEMHTPVQEMHTILTNSFTTDSINKNIPVSKKTGIDKSKTGIRKKQIMDYQQDERFMRFYNAYPKKEDPRDAWKAFKSIVGDDDALLEQILEDIAERSANHSQWQDKQFIKYPAVYLRKGAYLGEIFNEASDTQEKEAKKKEENEQRLKAQEEASRKRAEQDRQDEINKQRDAQAFRKVKSSIPIHIPAGLQALKESMKR